jgi:hypothetical protein
MKTKRSLTLMAAAIAVTSLLTLGGVEPLVAQTTVPPPTTPSPSTTLPDEEALHQELRGLKKTYEDAVIQTSRPGRKDAPTRVQLPRSNARWPMKPG